MGDLAIWMPVYAEAAVVGIATLHCSAVALFGLLMPLGYLFSQTRQIQQCLAAAPHTAAAQWLQILGNRVVGAPF